MLFNSLDFAVFFPLVFILYWIVAKHLTLRNALILVSSYVFYGWWDWRFLFLIFISSLVDFYIGKKLYQTELKSKRKQLLFVSIFVNLGFLLYFKYTNFFIETFVDSFRLFGNKLEVSTIDIILPVGISFYTFQTLSYTIDIYRRELVPTKDALSFFSFVAFFPQLVAGPIERASHLLPQFYRTYKFNYKQIKSGLLLMAFGLFKKMVIADRAAVLVNQVYNNPAEYYGYETIIATVLFAFQIYCDFSGYSDIAIGAARTMGFDLMKNFDSPYFSKSITEFWRRWHISLSTWFRDYVYIPLGGSKNGTYKMYANLFIVFLISGLWHGAATTFVVWGALHGTFIVIEKALISIRKRIFPSKKSPLNFILALPFTFFVVCVSWVFFRANSFSEALVVLKNSLYVVKHEDLFQLGLEKNEFWLLIFMILGLLIFEIIQKKFKPIQMLDGMYLPFRWSIYITIVFLIMVFGVYGENTIKEFIYFQF